MGAVFCLAKYGILISLTLILFAAFAPYAFAVELNCVTVSSSGNQGAAAGLEASCPEGYAVTGGGFTDLSGKSDDQDESFPIGNGWHCKKEGGTYAGTCYAVCCDSALIETRAISAVGNQEQGIFVSCSENYSVTGGGFDDNSKNNDDQDRLHPFANGWYCNEDHSSFGSMCYGICANARPGFKLSCITIQKEGNQNYGALVECPEGYAVTGGGFGGENQNNDDQDSSRPLWNGWYCQENNSISTAECYARCCKVELACTDNDMDDFNAEGNACGPIDCNDFDASIYPGAEEICNGRDDDCDGTIDENSDEMCDDGVYCNGQEFCGARQCEAGTPVNCDDGLECTNDECNEETDSCGHFPDDLLCDNGLFCDGTEYCDIQAGCVSGTPINCSAFNLNPVGTCFYAPDNNPFTWDYFAGFISECDEGNDRCRTGRVRLTHFCSKQQCQAMCEDNQDCPETVCESRCEGNNYLEYENVPNNCIECMCEQNACGQPTIHENDPRCIECLTDSDCDDNVFCNGQETCNTQTFTCETSAPVDCSHLSDQCNNGVCSEALELCVKMPVLDGMPCNDGLFCNVGEVCIQGVCGNGSHRDCSHNNIFGIAACDWIPDDNSFTWDYREEFISHCDEDANACTAGDETISHALDLRCAQCLNDSDCDDGLYCNGQETCNMQTFTCQPAVPVDCGDGIDCTVDSCNEDTNSCDNVPDDGLCDNGLFCDGEEICEPQAGCVSGEAVDCSQFDLPAVETCFYAPDTNPFTWDYFGGFTSVCDEDENRCTEGEEIIDSQCSILLCEAQCEADENCAGTVCADGCIGSDYYEYDDVPNNCVECVCEDNPCGEPTIYEDDPRCVTLDLNKIVGEPKEQWDGSDSIFYPEETAHCWDGSEQEIECWRVTMDTLITMECSSGAESTLQACFSVEVDGSDETEEYCETGLNSDGYCCGEAPVELYFLEETEHNLKFYCLGEHDNKSEVDEEKFKVEGEEFRIKLEKKWNLVSIPFMPLDANVWVVLEDIMENLESVWAYYDGNWHVFRPHSPESSTLGEIMPGYGYWVSMFDKDELLIGGSLLSPVTVPPSRQLGAGWNLIGFYGTYGQTYEEMEDYNYYCGENPFVEETTGAKAFCAVGSLIESANNRNVSALLSYINCGNNGYWAQLNLCNESASDFTMMYAGRGYWAYLNNPREYAPATICSWSEELLCV